MGATLRRRPLVVILLAAFVLRAGAALAVQYELSRLPQRSFLIEGDASGYWELGRRLAEGEDYAFYEPPRRVMRMPGFPMVLAGTIWLAERFGLIQGSTTGGRGFANGIFVARLLLAGVGTLACWLVYLLGKELFDSMTGLWAAGFSAVIPAFVGFSVLILSETLFAACLLVSLLSMAKLVQTGFDAGRQARGIWLSLAAGGAVGLACYVRPSWLAAGPLFVVLYFLMSPRSAMPKAALHGGLVLLGLVVAMAPWTIRNYRVTGHWVVTTLWVGPSLYDGLNPEATGASDMTFFDRDAVMRRKGLSEYEMDRYYRNKAWEFVRTHPGRALELAGVKLARFWKPWPNADQFGSVWHGLAVTVVFIPLLLLAACGTCVRRQKVWGWGLTLGPILYFSVIHMIFVGSLRYRLPAEYPLCVLAAAGLLSWWGPGRWSRLGHRRVAFGRTR